MTIDEFKKLKSEAEARVKSALAADVVKLQSETGLVVGMVNVSLFRVQTLGSGESAHVGAVKIDLEWE